MPEWEQHTVEKNLSFEVFFKSIIYFIKRNPVLLKICSIHLDLLLTKLPLIYTNQNNTMDYISLVDIGVINVFLEKNFLKIFLLPI